MATLIRTCKFSPYRKGAGPSFTLKLWDTGNLDSRGQTYLGYRLTTTDKVCVFEGEDFAGSPMHADDSDETVAGLMSFLCLQPGDTDADYFESYTAAQLAFAAEHAEALRCEVSNRFGNDS